MKTSKLGGWDLEIGKVAFSPIPATVGIWTKRKKKLVGLAPIYFRVLKLALGDNFFCGVDCNCFSETGENSFSFSPLRIFKILLKSFFFFFWTTFMYTWIFFFTYGGMEGGIRQWCQIQVDCGFCPRGIVIPRLTCQDLSISTAIFKKMSENCFFQKSFFSTQRYTRPYKLLDRPEGTQMLVK